MASFLIGIIISESVKYIGFHSFFALVNLKSVIFRSSVESVGGQLSQGGRTTIYFEALTKPNGWSESDDETNKTTSAKFFGCKLSEDGTYVVSSEKKADTFVLGDVETQDPIRKCYTFGGWTTKEGGTTADYTSENVNRAPNGTMLYAIWIKD